MIQDSPEQLLSLLQQHLNWYPLMKGRDVYKLLYQGVMGSEHLCPTQHEFSQRLASEFDRLPADRLERLLEPIRPDQRLFRINLRAYKARFSGVDALTSALMQTARTSLGEVEELGATWRVVVGFCDLGNLGGLNASTLHRLTSWLEEHAYPAIHHSKVYHQQYQPAYRLISGEFLPGLSLAYAG